MVIDRSLSRKEAELKATAVAWHRFQMPAYHLVRADGRGVTLINIGVGPANAKNITDHLAVLRPHCWLMVGHCGGLRQSQIIGDYVLAHAYLQARQHPRRRRAADDADPGDRRGAGGAAAGGGEGDRREGDALKRRLRTGTVVTNDDRNWELRWSKERRAHQPLARHRRRHGVGHHRRPKATACGCPTARLLCVSDKPLHGEIKLPGAANAFYERAIGEHLQIGLTAIDLLQSIDASLHSRKLRSFDEPPFR